MEQFIGCDAHKNFSVFVAVNEKGQAGEAFRVAHDRTLYREFLARLPARSAIAVEAGRNYSWLVDEMEWAGHRPKLCNPFEAKRRMGLTHKTDKLDARGLNFATERHVAGSLDSAERVARPTRAAAAPHLPGETAHASEESYSRNVIT
jgi:hypothetical protein